jgi:hypothetical protein
MLRRLNAPPDDGMGEGESEGQGEERSWGPVAVPGGLCVRWRDGEWMNRALRVSMRRSDGGMEPH